jgi:hypothetical protein
VTGFPAAREQAKMHGKAVNRDKGGGKARVVAFILSRADAAYERPGAPRLFCLPELWSPPADLVFELYKQSMSIGTRTVPADRRNPDGAAPRSATTRK